MATNAVLSEPIAVIGSGCRFPGGASSPSRLWNLLLQPRDVLSEIPHSRFNPHGFYNKVGETGGHSNVLHSYVLDEDIRAWDADFFRVSANEAAAIDPQQRLLMETVYEALEAGGQQLHALRGSDTAVYVGLMGEEYSDLQGRDLDLMPTYHATGTARSIMSNRISYFFDWHGASMTIDTACSSSLVAVHHCIQAIRNGYSRLAVAAGANLCLGPEPYISESTLHMLSPRGRSHMWDASADGYGRGEGVAAVVLKKLSDAVADGDAIECIIRETGVNQDGRTNGITVPSPDAQVVLIEDTYRRAGLDLDVPADRPQFFEAHGTGTGAGDPLEAEAIHRSIGRRLGAGEKLYVGSIKTVIGHTEGTAGIAGLMKVSLALQNCTIPPNMLFDKLNPKIEPFIERLEIPMKPTQWPNSPFKRASVNSFGFGGTNAHAIVERYEPVPALTSEEAEVSFTGPYVFSAVSKASLKQSLRNTVKFLDENPDVKARDLAHLLNSRRSTFTFRITYSGANLAILNQRIAESVQSPNWENDVVTRPSNQTSRILGIFTGQGAQWPGMGKQLLEASPIARARIREMELALATLQPGDRPSWSLMDELLAEGSKSKLDLAEYAQPLCTALQILLVDMLAAANVQFSAVIGHSSGEIGAAYAAGVLSARDSIVAAYYRGIHTRLAAGSNGQRGGMLAAGTTPSDAEELISLPQFEGRLCIAACNSPESVTLSGDADAIEEAKDILGDEKTFARTIRVDKAYHSHHMRPCSQPYIDSLRKCGLRAMKPRDGIVWYSSVHQGKTFTSADAEPLDDTYWAQNMAQTVLFSAAVKSAVTADQYSVTIEVGPHGTLKAPAVATIEACAGVVPTYISCLARKTDSMDTLSTTIGKLWAMSLEGSLDLDKYQITAYGPLRAAYLPLKSFPSYPWDNKRKFWSESRRSRAFRLRPEAGHFLLGTSSSESNETYRSWSNVLRLSNLPWVNGHQLQGQTVWPAAAYVATAVEAAKQVAKPYAGYLSFIELNDLEIGKAIAFESDRTAIESSFSLHIDKVFTVDELKFIDTTFFSRSSTGEAVDTTLNASGRMRLAVSGSQTSPSSTCLPPQQTTQTAMTNIDDKMFYNELKQLGYNYSGAFRALYSLTRKLDHGRGRLRRAPLTHDSEKSLLIHPGWLDAALQAVFLAYAYPGDGQIWSLHVPVSIGKIRIDAARCSSNVDDYFNVDSNTSLSTRLTQEHGLTGDVNIFSADGRAGLIQLEDIRLVPFAAASKAQDTQLYYINRWSVASPDGQLASLSNDASRPYEDDMMGGSYDTLAQIIGQITHVNPHTRMLQIGAGYRSATQIILEKVGPALEHYAFTAPSLDIVEEARVHLTSYAGRMAFQVLQPDEDMVMQGLRERSYDVVITLLMMSTISDASIYLKDIHRLLRPGGYIVMLEEISGALEPKRSDDRKGGYSTVECHNLLLRAGFTGIETSTSDAAHSKQSYGVLVSRAADEHINLLIEPSSIPSPLSQIDHLLIVSGLSLASVKLTETMRRLLIPHTRHISVIPTVADLKRVDMPARTTVLYLADLDEPVFSCYTPDSHAGLQKLWATAQTVLWTTRGARCNDPHALQSFGLGRAMMVEYAHARISVQFIDFAPTAHVEPYALRDDLLRLQILGKSSNSYPDHIWSKEPEIQIDELGRRWVPRIVPHNDLNDGYNAVRRSIHVDVDPARDIAEVVVSNRFNGPRLTLVRGTVSDFHAIDSQDRLHELRVLFTAGMPLRPSASPPLYLNIAREESTARLFLAVSTGIASIIRVPAEWLTPFNHPLSEASARLHAIAMRVLALLIIYNASSDATTLLLDPSKDLAKAALSAAADCNVRLHIVSSSPTDSDEHSIFINPHTSKRTLQKLVSSFNIASVIGSARSSALSAALSDHLPSGTVLTTIDEFEAHSLSLADFLLLPKQIIDTGPIGSFEPLVVGADAFVTYDQAAACILDWTRTMTVSVNVQPPDFRPVFRSDRTYLLLGLAGAGGLGLPLAEYMASLGARYIVLTSRSPDVDEHLASEYAAQGVFLRFIANDITDVNAVEHLVSEIRNSWPPIAGVANGANVLNDMHFKDMSHDDMIRVLAPKVEGTKILDRIFHDEPLDFFIGFSSISIVFGRSGQSNYDAANIFMLGVASKRRARGLNASVIDIGPISGVGLMARDVSENVMSLLVSHGYRKLSSRDFLETFINGVIVGRVESGEPEELITGLTLHAKYGKFRPTWADNARFSHLMLNADESPDISAIGVGKAESIQDRLLRSKTEGEVSAIVREALLAKLQNILNFSNETLADSESLLQQDTSSLGLDSLLAVELRTWMLAELEVDLPVLKILSDSPIHGFVDFAMQKLPPAFVPNLGSDTSDSASRNGTTTPETKRLDQVANFTPAVESVATPKQDSVPFTTVPDLQEVVDAMETELIPDTRSSSSTATSSVSLYADEADHSSSSQATSLRTSQNAAIGSIPEKVLPMSFGQSRFFVMQQIVQDPTAFNITCDVEIFSTIDKAALSRAVADVGLRHEALRTCFSSDENHQPIAMILKESCLHLEVVKGSVSELDTYFQEVQDTVYDLSKGDLMRAMLVSTSEISHHLIVGYHHINMDSTSFVVFVSEMLKIYAGQTLPLPKVQYPDFAQYQLEKYHKGSWNPHIAYWLKEFSTLPDPLPLLNISPNVYQPRPNLTSYQNRSIETRISVKVARQIQVICRKLKVTPFHLYTTVFQITLARLGATDDICIGMAEANRSDFGGAETSIGNFLNLLPLRLHTSLNVTFSAMVKETKSTILQALSNSVVPFDVILEKVGVQRSATHSPLFQAFIDYRHVAEKLPFGSGHLEGKRYVVSETPYDVMVELIDTPTGEASLKLIVQQALYSLDDAKTLMDCFTNLLETFTRDDGQVVGRVQMFDHIKVQSALSLGKGEIVNLKYSSILPELDEIAASQPQSIALEDSLGCALSWSEMRSKSIAVSQNLNRLKLARGSKVGVLQSPDVDWICSMLGIWRSELVYVPLETTQGARRLADIIREVRLGAVILHDSTLPLVSQLSLDSAVQTINVSTLPFAHLVNAIHITKLRPEEEAMIVYTSGSTGVPKGISIAHRVVINAVRSFLHRWPMAPQRILQQTALSFDVSWWAVVVGLATKGTVVVASAECRGDPRALTSLIISKKVTFTFAVPSESVAWLESGDTEALRTSSWIYHCSGGEPYSLSLVSQLQALAKPDLTAINIYGPTETMIPNAREVLYQEITAHDLPVPIGGVMPNFSARVVDPQGHPVPAGVPGQLVFAGAGIASGYVGSATMTAERFLRDDFASTLFIGNDWNLAHNSGDYGHLREETGEFILQARIKGDTQVKLRGLRIDMQDIEANILSASGHEVSEAIVHVHKPKQNDSSSDYLVAHVVMTADARQRYVTDTEQSTFLSRIRDNLRVPQYMRPAEMVVIAALPLTHHRKVDRKAVAQLPLPGRSTNHEGSPSQPVSQQPASIGNHRMRELWLDVLGMNVNAHNLVPTSDFFLIGGNSLLLIRVQGEIRKRHGLDVPLTQLFQKSTLAQMSSLLDENIGTASKTASAIDWISEIRLDPELASLRAVKSPMPGDGLTVALTGSTGFLGFELIKRLSHSPHVKTIHAIAVRKSMKLELLESPKVVIHKGDLSQPQLGMSTTILEQVFGTSHAVIHNGADVSFLKSYGSVRATNLESTKQLIQLAVKYNSVQHLHYVSTAGIATMLGHDLYEESIQSFPPSSSPEGYVLTKWASELYLERAAAVTNLTLTIHRPTAIVGEGAPTLDVMSNILRYSEEMHTVPSMSALEGTFQFVSVEKVASDLLSNVLAGPLTMTDGLSVHYRNHNGSPSDTVRIHELSQYLTKKLDKPVTVTPDAEWIPLAARAGMPDEVVEYMMGVNLTDRGGEKWTFPRAMNGTRP